MSATRTTSLAGMRVLVTGAGGFIGSHLVRRLHGQGVAVTGLDRDSGRLGTMAPLANFVGCDLRNAESVRHAVQQVRPQVVFHLAAHPDGKESGDQTYAALGVNVQATAHLLEALRELPAVSLVYGCSSKVYGNTGVPYHSGLPMEPLSSYAVSKLAGWGLVDVYRRVHGIQAVALRPTLVYGPGQAFNIFTFLCKAVAEGREQIELDGGSQTRDPIYIDDAISAFIAAAEHCGALNGQALPIGGGREISVGEMAELAVSLLGGRQKVVCRPANVRPTEMLRSWCDNAEARKALGWEPQVTLDEGILRTAESLGVAPQAELFAQPQP